MTKIKNLILNFIRGFCMALADSVPGVSGGTIAFLLGFYDKFIGSLDDLFRGDGKQRKEAFVFLIKLGIGWIIGFGLSVLILTEVFDSHIYAISSLFIGFIICAIPIVVREEKKALKSNYKSALFLVLGAALVILITVLNSSAAAGAGRSVEHLTLGLGVYVFVAAMIAISAMVLPGISGSTLLLVFGLYMPIMTAVKECMHLNFAYLPAVLIFIVGVICGVLLFVRLIKMALKNFRSQSIYAIIGLMVGSLYSITQGPLTLTVPQPAMTIGTFNILFFIIGAVVVLGLQVLKGVMEKSGATD